MKGQQLSPAAAPAAIAGFHSREENNYHWGGHRGLHPRAAVRPRMRVHHSKEYRHGQTEKPPNFLVF